MAEEMAVVLSRDKRARDITDFQYAKRQLIKLISLMCTAYFKKKKKGIKVGIREV